MYDLVDLAYQVIKMHKTIEEQELEILRLQVIERDYHKLLDDSISHANAMMGNTLKMLMTPGVAEACQKNAQNIQTIKEGEE